MITSIQSTKNNPTIKSLNSLKNYPWFPPLISAVFFFILSALFFLALGRQPFTLLGQVFMGAFGDMYSFTETLVKTSPILLCALAAAVPARLGLLTVGASGQFYLGAIFGAFVALNAHGAPIYLVLPAMLLGGAIGGALWSIFAGFLRARFEVNETLVTLLLNYIGAQIVDYLVYGPWRDTANLGWPATPAFPDTAKLPAFGSSRLHWGIVIGITLAFSLHFLFTKTRIGLMLRVMKSNRKVALWAGLNTSMATILLMGLGGALAGLAGICETSAIQGRLQSGIAANFGLTGFLVAWMSRQHLLRIIPYSLAMGALLAASDALQLFAQLPAASAVVLQALLFLAVFSATRLFPGKGV